MPAWVRSLSAYVAVLIAATGAVWVLQGESAVIEAAKGSLALLVSIAPIVIGAMLLSGYFQHLVPRDKVTRFFGEGTGMRGLLIASVAGSLTPGGPFAAFPLVVAIYQAGAGIGATTAYLTAWTVIGVQRLVMWELPILGPKLTSVRVLASLPLPIVAGFTANYLARFWPRPAPEEGR